MSLTKILTAIRKRATALAVAIAFSLLCTFVQAAVINIPMLTEPVDVSTTPSIHVIAHGPSSIDVYRLTVEISNADPTCTLTLSNVPPQVPFWLTYDDDSATSYPLKAMRQISWSVFDNNQVYMVQKPVELPVLFVPQKIAVVADLDFEIPAKIPESFTLHSTNVDVDCTSTLNIERKFPFISPKVLSMLRDSASVGTDAARK